MSDKLHEFPLGNEGDWFVGVQHGCFYDAIDGTALSGERSEAFYAQQGPYVHISKEEMEWLKIRLLVDRELADARRIAELEAELAEIRKLVNGGSK